MMTDTKADRPSHFPWPPIIVITMIIAGFALNHYIPLGWVYPPLSDFLSFLGFMVVAIALAFDVWAMRVLKDHNTTVMPHKRSTALVSKGPYSFSRNPIYLGNIMLMIGLGFMFGILWHFPLALVGGLLTSLFAIRGEEQHLAHNFPRDWRNYSQKVRRWF